MSCRDSVAMSMSLVRALAQARDVDELVEVCISQLRMTGPALKETNRVAPKENKKRKATVDISVDELRKHECDTIKTLVKMWKTIKHFEHAVEDIMTNVMNQLYDTQTYEMTMDEPQPKLCDIHFHRFKMSEGVEIEGSSYISLHIEGSIERFSFKAFATGRNDNGKLRLFYVDYERWEPLQNEDEHTLCV